MKRTKHNLSNYKLASFDMGKLIPVGLIECLPGDTMQGSTAMLLRLAPQLAPVMHPVSVRLHHWFVPHRLTFPEWEEFITGGNDGLGDGSVYPTGGGVVLKNSAMDYLGVAPGTYTAPALGLLPIYAYNLIFNENYRDQDLQIEHALGDFSTKYICWEKDYFTTARPWTQRGPDVVVPIGGSAPVVSTGAYPVFRDVDAVDKNLAAENALAHAFLSAAGGVTPDPPAGAPSRVLFGDPTGLEADLSASTGANIIAFRQAFALQRYQEARAQYGARYTEYLRYLGIRPSDSRLMRPEYIGGGKQTVSFSEVLDTAGVGGGGVVGTMKGHGIAAMRSNRFRYFCEEHGYIMSLLSVRPRAMYTQGLDRHWSRRSKEDYFQKELADVGQQEVKNKELYWQNAAADDDVFGYQDRYSEYRHQKSTIAGDFRDTFNFWHLARSFTGLPTLNETFIQCDPTKRIFALTTEDVIFGMISHHVQARRMVGNRTIGRIM